MDDDTTGAPAAPTGTDPIATPAAAPVAAAPIAPQQATPNQDPTAEPNWLSGRLAKAEASARAKLLKEFGFDKADDVKGRLAKAKELEDAQLSEQERTQKRIEELTRQADAATGVSAVASDAVQELFDALPEQARLAIEELNPQTPAERLKLVRAFRKVASSQVTQPAALAAPTAPVAPAAPPPPMPTPANTAAPPTAPRPSGTKTKWDEFSELNRKNPTAGGIFWNANRVAIEASRPAS